MKKVHILLFVLVACLALAGCSEKHEWVDANCETPKTCSECGQTEGEALGHNWTDATCEQAKTCSECGLTEGEALGHDWQEATCEQAKTCTICAATEGAEKHTPDRRSGSPTLKESGDGYLYQGNCADCGGSVEIAVDDMDTFAAELIAGYYDQAYLYADQLYPLEQQIKLDLAEDGSCIYSVDDQQLTGTWTFYNIENGLITYELNFGDSGMLAAFIPIDQPGWLLLMVNSEQILLIM